MDVNGSAGPPCPKPGGVPWFGLLPRRAKLVEAGSTKSAKAQELMSTNHAILGSAFQVQIPAFPADSIPNFSSSHSLAFSKSVNMSSSSRSSYASAFLTTMPMVKLIAAVVFIAAVIGSTSAAPAPNPKAQTNQEVANAKRSFDSFNSRGFTGFDKRAFDSFAGPGFTGFDKRSFDSFNSRGFTGFDKRSPFDSFVGSGFTGLDKRSFDSFNNRGFTGFDKRAFDSFAGHGFTGFDKRAPFDSFNSRGFTGFD
ncbi:orcokinin peptides type B [Ditylenchus destructor]|uniref:Orcokinin peptides type B n=1 Tax=Ditylenchus destructor TaxID=166010 RepID=A0AAD4N9S1_9BILA|nr:orcokinin peptides type B [Ditylenchus destructor]